MTSSLTKWWADWFRTGGIEPGGRDQVLPSRAELAAELRNNIPARLAANVSINGTHRGGDGGTTVPSGTTIGIIRRTDFLRPFGGSISAESTPMPAITVSLYSIFEIYKAISSKQPSPR